MLDTALDLSGPASIRYPTGSARHVAADQVGSGLSARHVRDGDGRVCILAVGKMLEAAEEAAAILAADGVEATVWDVRVVKPLDPAMIADAGGHALVVTVEDGLRTGGAGSSIVDAIADLTETRVSPPVLVLGVPTSYIPHGKVDAILTQLGLDGAGIAAATAKALPSPL
jgi:1-deoxy-D-xylulose-5-phosphate synthase